MKARYQYRFYPTNQQQKRLRSLFGCVRVVWNDALAFSKETDKYLGYNKLAGLLTQTKKTDERKWLSEVSSVPLQQSLKAIDSAYKNFFDSCKGKRKGKKVGYPKFKKRTNKQSATFVTSGFSIKNGSVYLAKIGNLTPIWSRALPSEPSSVTVIKDCADRYFLSFVIEIESVSTEAINQSIGIDLGIKTFAVMSDGTKAVSPSYKKLDRKVRSFQKKLARQQKNSKHRNKTRLKIAKTHNRIADTRKDFLHKLSTKVVSENQTIILEDLNVSGMVKNRKLSRAISLLGWREFRTFCEAKAEKYNRDFRVISRWEPTSQICNDCGYKWGKLDLSIRSVLCINCGIQQDRDENAAKNINKVGTGHRHDSKRTQRQSKTTLVASVVEASRITAASAQ
ncbi:RNA-guided endonuclease InsQ/TnpB family protein [Synechocystis sp. PCC 7509]|uniref:RNA-guided endonuclease InsQ/TnpB family protein n=1 Tax=Synechocystis sp. PCC 7509 TaxID=927677 RepID=UPI0002ABB790|nr:RNA-guided endonuclease TnpB family protein [Synechocystis sp. PCC 7509]